MTNPFQSIISEAHTPTTHQERHQDEHDILAEDLRADELADIRMSLGMPPFGDPRPDNQLAEDLQAEQLIEIRDSLNKPLSGIPATVPETYTLQSPKARKPLRGGSYTPADALELLNSHFFVGKNNQETAIFRINDDGSVTFIQPEQFKLEIQNIRVGSDKPIPAEKFWRESPRRHERKIVFKPVGTIEPDEFNLWRGFGVEARKGWQKQRSLLRHIREVICRRDREKFKYLVRVLAWCVQHPDKHSGVVIVLKSRKQGTGKSTLGNVMLKIFGPHGMLIDDKERLLGRFNDGLENVCFGLAEEILWAGDHKAADKLKSLITGDTIQIERKFGSCRQIPNRLKIIATTNHDHAVAAGVRDRRNVVYDVCDERVGDKAWFDNLHRDLANGGTSEFLYLLQNLQLGGWHPREILRTAETAEQQRMSGDSVSQWAQACIDADTIVGSILVMSDLGTSMSAERLREAYTGFCKQHGLRTLDSFGKACADMFGPRKRLAEIQAPNGRRRPWGYHIPNGDEWQEKLDARLGIKN